MKTPFLLYFIFFLLIYNYGYSQIDSTQSKEINDPIDYFALSIEDLLNLKVTVASKKTLTHQESPGIITIISDLEIKNSGARDLIDVLRLVPGFSFGYDVTGIVGLSSRGIWGHEGKILLMIDGQEINENLFSTTQFGNHYDVSQIQKIEIIRGPGSAIYGGYAELGVINLITKSGENTKGISTTATYGTNKENYMRKNLSLSVGDKVGDLEYSLSGFLGRGQRSTTDYKDIYGDSNTMNNQSALDPSSLNFAIEYKGLEARVLYDNYKTSSIAFYDYVLDSPITSQFQSLNTQLKYDWKINNKLIITPKINYIKQNPWTTIGSEEEIEYIYNENQYYHITTNKIVSNISASYDLNTNINLIAGTEYYIENATNRDKEINEYFINGTNKISFNTLSIFTQALIKNRIANVTLGNRVISHNQFGKAFAPRIGLTKVINNFHAKALYSNAFRAPGIENINLNESISPEKTRVIELELGYKLSAKTLITTNVFDITINNPIVFFYNEETDQESYENFSKTGSRGFEVEYKIKDTWGYINLNYSYYTTAGKNDVDYYTVDNNKNIVVGIPTNSININSSFKLLDNLFLNPSFSYIGTRYAFTSLNENEETVLSRIAPTSLFNFNLLYTNLFTTGLDLSIGFYDFFNQKILYAQPYNGYNSPLNGGAREFVVRLNYDLKFKQ